MKSIVIKMIRSYQNTKELFHVNLRVTKKDSVYLYFLLESQEGICFYSTINESISDPLFREIEIYSTIEYMDDVNNLITNLKNEIDIETLFSRVVIDNPDIKLK
ncbi:MAG: hypothetical protein HQK49_03150 [Oligoflexia bacterium]|nr:hypothetical protein [Oligoflexia bacterium]